MGKKNIGRVDLPILETNIKTGLTEEQVQERIDKGYGNKIKVKDSKTIPEIIFKNVFTFFNTILISVAIVFLVFVFLLRARGRTDIVNAYFGFSKFLFVFPAVLNITTGTIQEIHSKKIIDSLKIVTSATSKVIRDSKEQDVPCSNVVRDDILILQAGEQAACDMILLEGSLQVDESMLTGEADHIKKMPGDTVYSGSAVIVGYAKMRVAEVGDYTYVSKLQSKVKSLSNHTSELMDSIVKILKVLTLILAIVVVTIVITMMIKINLYGENGYLWGRNGEWKTLSLGDLETWARIMVTAGSFAIGIIPSGLVLTTSLTLITSIVKLSRQHTLIQELYSLENLSRVDVICLDKTGTLTDGTMKLVEVKRYEHLEIIEEHIQNLLGAMDTRNQTAEAIYQKFGSKETEIKEFLPFSSDKKSSGLIYPNGDTLLMGAPEYLLDKDDNRLKFVQEKAQEGKRVIALKLNEQLLSFFVIEDQIRSTAPATLKFFKENNVTVKVISGDNPITVAKIAKDCGIENAHKAISLEGMSLEEIPNIAEEYTVFARVSPEQKAALVDALQNKGHKVAMTGDGVNDILALRKANASITFAKATDAAKSCSDVILLDNDFSHLKEVVGQGRRVINNVQRTSILFLMKSFAIAILAFALIAFRKGQMWYTIENAYLLEATVIGVGGILLSLEGTKQPLRGSFFKNIIYKAIFSGLLTNIAIIVPIMCWTIPEYYGLHTIVTDASGHVVRSIGYLIESEDMVRALITILLTLSGLVTMLIMSLPLNKFRIFAFVSVLFAITGLAFLFPTSYIGGQPTSSDMFIFNHTTQTFLDCRFMREMFHPWRAPVMISFFDSAWTKYYMIIMFLFIWQAIPIYFITIRIINRQLKISYKREEEERIAKKLALENKELPQQIQA